MTTALQAADEGRFPPAARQISKWIDHVLGPPYRQYGPDKTWSPAINFYEDAARYCILVELAGLAAGEIEIRVEAGLLVIAGSRIPPAMPNACSQVRMHLMEIDCGPFVRRLELPKDADADSVEATYRGGYLWIALLKRT